MLKVGLTGGLASGKSLVGRELERLGCRLIRADDLGHAAIAPGGPAYKDVVREFGPEILHEDGSLNRERLGSIVFADKERLAALNGIVHPLVGERVAELQEAAPADAVVVYDVPLLTENNLAAMYDLVIVVDASDEIRLRRLTDLRGMSESDAKARIAAQATREDRLKIADIVIVNEGTLDDLQTRADEVWRELAARADASGS